MREIKFRAWDKGRRLIHRNILSIDVGFESHNNVYLEGTGYCLNQDEYVLMQYTGLKDKNGVEIYDGDVLEYISPDYIGEGGRTDKYVVEWKGFGFEARWSNPLTPSYTSDGHMALQGVDEDMQVIGNIYENSELLEAGDES